MECIVIDCGKPSLNPRLNSATAEPCHTKAKTGKILWAEKWVKRCWGSVRRNYRYHPNSQGTSTGHHQKGLCLVLMMMMVMVMMKNFRQSNISWYEKYNSIFLNSGWVDGLKGLWVWWADEGIAAHIFPSFVWALRACHLQQELFLVLCAISGLQF